MVEGWGTTGTNVSPFGHEYTPLLYTAGLTDTPFTHQLDDPSAHVWVKMESDQQIPSRAEDAARPSSPCDPRGPGGPWLPAGPLCVSATASAAADRNIASAMIAENTLFTASPAR